MLGYVKMLSSDFQVTRPNDDQIQRYWSWLLSVNPDINPIPSPNNDVFYLRAWYNYIDDIQDARSDHPKRKNVGGDNPFTVGSESQPFHISNNVCIFVPLLDTVVTDHDHDSNGNLLTDADAINSILKNENDQIKEGNLKATIENLTAGTGEQDIDGNLLRFRTTSPSNSNAAMFPLTIPQGSTLADKMEFPAPQGLTVQARAEGVYLLLCNLTPGNTYHIKNRNHGLRHYNVHNDYYIYVEQATL